MAHYSIVYRLFHWLTVLLVVTLFPLGLWMGGLDYYDEWYRKAPALHISLGVCLLMIVVGRLLNRALSKRPPPLSTHSRIERLAATVAHIGLYGMLVLMVATGYFLASIEGQGVEVFGLFTLPGIAGGEAELEDAVEEVHEIVAWCLVLLASLHGLAAVKHHFIDKDDTLKRMTH